MTEQKLPVVHRGTAGRPPYSDDVRKAILKNLEIGCTRTAAAGSAGVDDSTFRRWQNDIPGFRAAVEEAEAKAERMYTGRLARRAAAGDTRAIEFWLSRRRGNAWRERVSVVDEEASLEDVIAGAEQDDAIAARLADLAREAERRRASETSRSDDLGGSAPESEPN
jgi:hypothetical protein